MLPFIAANERCPIVRVEPGLPVDLTGRVAVVTGANHGIGAAAARQLAACGASVLVAYLRTHDEPDAESPYARQRRRDGTHVVSSIVEAGGRAAQLEVDLSRPDAAVEILDAAERAFGPVDILVNNASAWLADTFRQDQIDRFGRPLTQVSALTFDKQFAVDARATAVLIAEFAERHHRHGLSWGRIIGMTSGGPQGFPGEVSYGAAKAALENFTMSAAFELADRGITANVVYPPVTDTGWVTDEVRESVDSSPTHIHVAEPEDVAEVIAFLASDHARLITGNIIHLR